MEDTKQPNLILQVRTGYLSDAANRRCKFPGDGETLSPDWVARPQQRAGTEAVSAATCVKVSKEILAKGQQS